jgi:hypothetical protein
VTIERELDERIERYLDGELAPSESYALERELAEPGGREALSSSLLLREALRDAGPAEPPVGLENRILEALAVERVSLVPAPEAQWPAGDRGPEREGAWASARAAAGGMSYVWRGPALAAAGLAAGNVGGAGALNGLANARWVLGPLASMVSSESESESESGAAPEIRPATGGWAGLANARRLLAPLASAVVPKPKPAQPQPWWRRLLRRRKAAA